MTDTTATSHKRIRIKRSTAMNLTLTEDVKGRMQAIADAYGMPPSTLASYAIGHFVAHQERSLQIVADMTDKLANQFGEEMRKQLNLFSGPAQDKAKAET